MNIEDQFKAIQKLLLEDPEIPKEGKAELESYVHAEMYNVAVVHLGKGDVHVRLLYEKEVFTAGPRVVGRISLVEDVALPHLGLLIQNLQKARRIHENVAALGGGQLLFKHVVLPLSRLSDDLPDRPMVLEQDPNEGLAPGTHLVLPQDQQVEVILDLSAGIRRSQESRDIRRRIERENPNPAFVVDGHEFDNPESSLLGDGEYPPFRVLDTLDQTYIHGEWPTREKAQAEADRKNAEGSGA